MSGQRSFNPAVNAIGHDRNSMVYPIIAASRELLRRQLLHKQHQITCPEKFAAAVASVAA